MRKEFDNHVLLARHVVHGSLWLAPDHLLVIETTSFLLPFRERYRRIDYDSVQGVFVARTLRSLTITILCLVSILFLGGLAALIALTSSLQAMAVFFGILAGLVAVVLGVNLHKGPSGRLSVQTAVQAHRLGPVRRLRKARLVLEALRVRCEAAQGGPLAPADTPSPAPPVSPVMVQGHAMAPPPLPLADGTPVVPAAPLAWMPHPTTIPGYASVVLAGGAFAGELAVNSPSYSVAMTIPGLVALILLGFAAARRHGPRWNGGFWPWGGSLAFLLLDGAFAYGIAVAGMVAEAENSQQIQVEGTMTMIRKLALFPDGFPRGLAVAFLACALLTAAFGLLGITTTLGQRRRLRRLGPPPPSDQPPPPAASPADAGPPPAAG